MPSAHLLQTNFNAGEWTSELAGRVDLAKYANSCATLKNFIPRIEGHVVKRPGTRFLKEVKDSSAKTRLIAFEFSNEQAYWLEFGNLYFRVYRDGGAVLETALAITGLTNATPRVVTRAAHGYVNGNEVFITGTSTELDNRYWIVANATANTFECAGSVVGTAWVAGGTVARTYTVTTPYATADLFELQVIQSADTMYVAHPDYAPRKITRTGHTSWTVTEIAFAWPPFLPENTSNITLDASSKTGAITITASAALFTANDVGRFIRFREVVPEVQVTWGPLRNLQRNDTVLSVGDYAQYAGNVYELQDKHGATTNCGESPPVHTTFGAEENDGKWDWTYIHSGEGYAVITAFTSSTLVSATVVSQLPNVDSSATSPPATKLWSWGAWDSVSGYPRSVTLYEDRLWWAGTDAEPQGLWGSRIGDYENHRSAPTDISAVLFFLSTDDVNVIEWIQGGKVLSIGTASSEFAATGADADDPISISNPMRAVLHATNGSRAGRRPIVVNNATLFIQRGGQRIREMSFDFASDAFITQDMTLLASHLTRGQVSDWAWQSKPGRFLWVTSDDGVSAVCVYDRQQDVIGFAEVEPGGSFSGGQAVIESMASIPHWDGDEDATAVIVKRTINGGTKRYIEYFEKPWRDNFADADQVFVDSSLEFVGSGATISGLWHLIGQTVRVQADGSDAGSYVVSAAGQITGVSPAVVAKAQIGLAFIADLETQRLEQATRQGTSQGRTKRLGPITLRVWETGAGLEVGPSSAQLTTVRWTQNQDPVGAALGLYTGDTAEFSITPQHGQEGKLFIRHGTPLACSVQLIAQRASIGE